LVALEALLAEAPQDPPCGPNLEYDPDFMALDQAARGKPEQRTGDASIPAREPEWPDVRERAEALLLRTKDLRVAVILCRALVRTDGFDGLASGLGLIGELLSRYWDQLHPALDPDDGDQTMRLNALAPLADPGPLSDPDTLLRDVRNLQFVDAGARGRVTVRDVLVALGKQPASAGSSVPEMAQLAEVIRSESEKTPTLAAAVIQSRDALQSIVALLSEKAGDTPVPDMRLLQEALGAAARAFEPEPEKSEAVADGRGGGSAGALGEIRSRNDAVRHLERVCEFLERTEPAHPAPLLIRRAQRLMAKNFVEIIEDLAPGGLSEIQKIAGLENK